MRACPMCKENPIAWDLKNYMECPCGLCFRNGKKSLMNAQNTVYSIFSGLALNH
jgi:hypothetical protein